MLHHIFICPDSCDGNLRHAVIVIAPIHGIIRVTLVCYNTLGKEG